MSAEGFLAKPLEPVELTAQIRAMAKVKRANRRQEIEKAQLEARIAERTQALQASEAMFRNLFEKYTAVKLVIDPIDGSIVDANEAAASFYGWSRDELRRMKISDIKTLSPEQVKALEMFKVKSNDIDLVLMDLNMPTKYLKQTPHKEEES